ncbi:DUF368 domain-containing protein [Halosquirtibacter xylanolyticus]|uniref:DUF368 domain-containing protein n=1 Tax=Halosquirtibacter xylanolyticus TaxID=3374599 RepID=UPI003747BDF5|nr:DUF368 domain-containing protein [Prolixibacteraceae bacterium]
MRNSILLFFKGVAMGAANVIPGVSGGTIALLTGIFNPIIDAIKNVNTTTFKMFFKGDFKGVAEQVNLKLLIPVFFGVFVSLISLAKLFKYLFAAYPIYIWSFFFGLILASVYFVAKQIKQCNLSTIVTFVIGTAIALSISFMTPASENSSTMYLMLCGVVAACSMILPGLSGSFVLILLGNYELVMIRSVSSLDWSILAPVAVGAVIGLVAFSHLLSWVFKKYHDQTISLLSGFILGSLCILWPWKRKLYKLGMNGEVLIKKSGEKVVEGYQWFMPDMMSTEFMIATLCMIVGVVSIVALEKFAGSSND